MTVSNNKITASVVNNTDGDKPVAMAVIGKNINYEYVFSQWISDKVEQSEETLLEADISQSGAAEYEIVFVILESPSP